MMSILRTIRIRISVQRSGRTRNMQRLFHRTCIAAVLLVAIAVVAQTLYAAGGGQTKFRRISTQSWQRWVLQMRAPGKARNGGVCGRWTQVEA